MVPMFRVDGEGVVCCGGYASYIVPRTLQGRLLDELHQDYPGITRMKSVARSYSVATCGGLDSTRLLRTLPRAVPRV